MLWYLYAIRLPVNDYAVAYIGVSKNPRDRWTHHRANVIGEAIRICGRKNVLFQRLVCGTSDFIYDMERAAIAAFNTRPPNGYNLAAGGQIARGGEALPTTRAKLAEKYKTNLAFQAACREPKSAEHKAKFRSVLRRPEVVGAMLKALIGVKQTPEQVAKRVASRLATVKRDGNKLVGRKASPEHTAKTVATKARKKVERGGLPLPPRGPLPTATRTKLSRIAFQRYEQKETTTNSAKRQRRYRKRLCERFGTTVRQAMQMQKAVRERLAA